MAHAPRAARLWSATPQMLCAVVAVLLVLGATSCRKHQSQPSPASGSSSNSSSTLQVQPSQRGGPSGGSLPSMGTPFQPSGHPSVSLPSLPGSGS
jgi:hypothetical protein